MDHVSHQIQGFTKLISSVFYCMGASIWLQACCRWGIDVQNLWKTQVWPWLYENLRMIKLIVVPRTLRKGKHKLNLWADVEGDGNTETSTPSKVEHRDEMDRLEKVGARACVCKPREVLKNRGVFAVDEKVR
jgi:hypothetical protein